MVGTINMLESYQHIIKKIDGFIRKYYMNLLIRGALIAGIIVLASFLLVTALEYVGHYSVQVRTVLFYSVLSLYLIVFYFFFLRPLLWFLGIKRKIGRKQAAELLAKSFPEIKDTLINLIELKELSEQNAAQNDLILASIQQRSEWLSPVPFVKAVKFQTNFKWLAWFSLPLSILLLLLLIHPNLISSGTERIIKHREYFEIPLPFSFHLLNDSLEVEKGNDFEIVLQMEGSEIPDQVFLEYSGTRFLMTKVQTGRFTYSYRNLYNPVSFQFYANGVNSKKYTIQVLPTPTILNFKLKVQPPSYTGEEMQEFSNIGDVSVPQGSILTWNIQTNDLDSLSLSLADTTLALQQIDNQHYQWEKSILKSQKYTISAANEFIRKENLLSFFIEVIPDVAPAIEVVQSQDSLQPQYYYFKGGISDDYGFTKLQFILELNGEIDSVINIPFYKETLSQSFYYAFNFAGLKLSNEATLDYYFEVSDNDEVNGYKTTRSQKYSFYIPGKEELENLSEQSNEKMEEILRESSKMAEKMRKDLEELKKKSLTEDLSNWEKKEMIQNLMNQQKSLEEMIQEVKQENAVKNQMENTFDPMSQELFEKQQQLEELMEELFDDELKELLDELRNMQEQLDEKQLNELTKDLEFSMEDLNKRLDQSLEQLRKFEVEQKIEKSIEELKELAKEQQELSENIDEKGVGEEQQKKNEEQEKRFEKAMENYQEALEKNEELKRPMDLDAMDKDQQEVKDQFQESNQEMQKGNDKKSSSSAKKNAQKLQEMAQKIDMKMKSMKKKKQSEDIDNLRQIMENLIKFSFNQEDLMVETGELDPFNPRINDIVIQQNKIKNDFTIIKDSLDALVIRNPMAGNGINPDLLTIRKKMALLEGAFEELNLGFITREQQFIMTSANNLALLLSETLDQMMQEMNSMGGKSDGEQDCEKPGSQSEGFEGLKEMQQGLKEQIQKMMEQMQQGKGTGQQPGNSGLNRQIAQMMAQQEIFKDMLQKMNGQEGLSQDTREILKEINKMVEDSERDVVNKKITKELFKRQEEILTRLLEAEESENQREIEEKRESKENKSNEISNPEDYFKQKKEWENDVEIIEYQEIKLNNYYRKRYNNFIQRLTN